jgi:hypothetical protein
MPVISDAICASISVTNGKYFISTIGFVCKIGAWIKTALFDVKTRIKDISIITAITELTSARRHRGILSLNTPCLAGITLSFAASS